MTDYIIQAIYIFNVLILFYVLLVDSFYLILFVLSVRQIKDYMNRFVYIEIDEMSKSQITPPVSVIIPAYNEELTVKDSVSAILYLSYPEHEVIVVNDGSVDSTLSILIESFDMIKINQAVRQQIQVKPIRGIYRSIKFPNLIVIDKENGGKGDALNAGINVSNYPYYCAIDADSILEHDALLKTMSPFFEGAENVVACSGIVRLANGCIIRNGRVIEVGLPKNVLAIHQVIEYLRSFLMGRLGLSSINNLLIISGAFGVFRKKEIIEIGGYNNNVVGEDMELVIRLQKYLYDNKINGKVIFVPNPVCWTEAPETFKILHRQRDRWNRGLFESLSLNKKTIFNPKYKLMGLVAMPYYLIVELLGPPIEFLGYIVVGLSVYFGIINIPFAILFACATILFGIFLSIGSVFLEEWSLKRYPKVKHLLKLTFFSILDNFWYRQLNSFWKTLSFFKSFKKDKSWGHMQRKGFSTDNKAKESISVKRGL